MINFETLMIISYLILFIGIFTFMFWFSIETRKNKENMKKNITKKIDSNIDLNSKSLITIGEAHNLSPLQSRKVLYKVYSETNDKDKFIKIENIVQDIKKEEPYDGLPDEVKPSLIRIAKITSNMDEESDQNILTPITQIMTKYVELRDTQDRLKKRTNIAYVITIISFIIGTISFYFTIQTPSASDIAKEINKSNVNQIAPNIDSK